MTEFSDTYLDETATIVAQLDRGSIEDVYGNNPTSYMLFGRVKW